VESSLAVFIIVELVYGASSGTWHAKRLAGPPTFVRVRRGERPTFARYATVRTGAEDGTNTPVNSARAFGYTGKTRRLRPMPRTCSTTERRRTLRPACARFRCPGTRGGVSCTCSMIACCSRVIRLRGARASGTSSRSGTRAGIHVLSSPNRLASCPRIASTGCFLVTAGSRTCRARKCVLACSR
jgi:hypothetical protein